LLDILIEFDKICISLEKVALRGLFFFYPKF
jgi:hypothetical protein